MATANPLESETSAWSVRVKLPSRRYQSKKPQIKDKLTIYFQQNQVSGGCEVEDINVLLEDDSGLWMTVTFTEPFGVTRVLENHRHQLLIDGIVTPIEVHAHLLPGGHSSLAPETFRQFHGDNEQVFEIGETEVVENEEDEEVLMVEVTGFKPTTSEEHLKLYFENPGRSGGGDIKTWEKDPKTGNTIRLSFEDQSVARSVTSRAHRVDGAILSLVLTVKKPPRSRPVKKHGLSLSGIPDGCSTEHLSLFVENRSGLENPTIQYGEMPGTAICTFSEEIPDLDKVIQRICSKKLQGVSLTAERVHETDCILVEGFSSNTSLDLIELYFENKRKSGGGEVREVEQGPADGQAVVYFEDWKVVGDVLSRGKPHIIGKQKLSVEEYHSNLGRLGQSNAPTRHMPKSFSIEVEEKKMMFIFGKGSDMKTMLFVELKRANCVLHWPDGDIKTSARIEPFVQDGQRRSSWNNWTEDAVGILQGFLGRCNSPRIAVPQQMWEDVIIKVRQLDSRCYTVEENAQRHIVQLVGEQQAVETGVAQINGIIKEIKDQAEYDAQRIKKDVVLQSIQLQQLTCCGIKEKLEQDFPDIDITISTKLDQTYLILEGTRKLVQDAELSMRRQMDELKDTTINTGAAKLLFIKNISDKLHDKLRSKGILVAFTTVREDRIVIYGPRDADLIQAKEYLNRKIEEDVIPVKTPEAVRSLQSDQGTELLRKINERDFVAANIVKTKDGIVVAGFKSELKEAKDEIMMFLKTNTVTNYCIRMSKSKEESIVKTYGGEFDKFVKENEHHHVKILPSSGWTAGISIEGNQEGLEKARQFINSLVSKTEEEQGPSSDEADSPGQEAGHGRGVIHHKHHLDKTSDCSRRSQSECLAEEVLRRFLSSKEFLHLTNTSKELKASSASDVDHTVERPMQRADGSAVNEETLKEIYPESYDYTNYVAFPSDKPGLFVDSPEEMQDVSETLTLEPGTKLRSPVPYEDKTSGKVADNQHTVQDNSVIADMHIYEFIETFEKESFQKIQKDHKVKIKPVSDTAEKNERTVTFTPSSSNSKAGDVAEAREKFIILYQEVSNDMSRKTIDCSSATKAQIKEATKKILSDFKTDTAIFKLDGSSNNRLILRRGVVNEVARKFREYAGIRSGKSLRSRAPDVQKTLAPKTDVPQSMGSNYQNTPSRQGLEQADGSFSFVTNEGISIVVRQGDITKQSVQALVRPTDTYLSKYGGVAKAVFAAAGKELDNCCWDIKNSCRPNQPLEMTKCIVTPGFKLSCLIIHACGPVWYSYSSSRYQGQLSDTLMNCFHAAKESKVQTLAIPLIGSGTSAAPKDACADVLVNAVVDYSFNTQGNAFLKEILLVNIDRESTEAIKKSLHSVKATAAASYNIPKIPGTTSGGNMRQEHPLSDVPDDGNKVKQPHQGQEQSVWAQWQYQGSGRNYPYFAAWGATPTSSASGFTPSSTFGITPTSSVHSSTTPTSFATSGTTPTSSAALGATSTSSAASRALPRVSTKDTDRDASCPICLADVLTDEVVLKCKHRFCKGCFNKAMETSYRCPICQALCGEPKGDQPPGTMNVTTSQYLHLKGYPNDGVITIMYDIRSGRRTAFHPTPGKYFSGTSRTAYLPDNNEGREVLRLLEKAFDARLVFTIGRSVTTGVENKVTWNDIHHKTNMSGGSTNFGYPDPDYLKRVKEELKAKGIE